MGMLKDSFNSNLFHTFNGNGTAQITMYLSTTVPCLKLYDFTSGTSCLDALCLLTSLLCNLNFPISVISPRNASIP